MIVLLDSSPLGMLTNPKATQKTRDITNWLISLQKAKVEVKVPEICDYEVRRSLLKINSTNAIKKLDYLGQNVGYIKINTETMHLAAKLWADLRQKNLATSGDKELDGDVILAAQAITLKALPENAKKRVVVASENLKHLTRLVEADTWQNIKPL